MDITTVTAIVDLVIKGGGAILAFAAAGWGVNKLWLSQIYLSKKEFTDWMKTEYKAYLKNSDGIEIQFKDDIVEIKHRLEISDRQYTSDTEKNELKEKYREEKADSRQKHLIDNLHTLTNKVAAMTAISPETLVKMGDEIERFKKEIIGEVAALKSKTN